MRRPLNYLLFWGGAAVGSIALHYFFVAIIGMPIATLLTLALIGTWTLPRPWRFLAVLAIIGETWAVTPPLEVAAAVFSPLLLWWLRGRVEVDISFLYSGVVAVSAALAIGIVVGVTVYPFWTNIPWLIVLLSWSSVAVLATVLTIVLPSLHSRLLYGRYF